MKDAWSLVCLVAALSPVSALDVQDSQALHQAGAIEQSGGALVYDNNPSRGSVSIGGSGAVRAAADACDDETCGLRRGGPPPSELRREPKSPFTKAKEDEEREKKSRNKHGFNWMGAAMIGLGAAGGAVAGFLIGGPWGALIGGILGGLLGWLAPKLMR